MKIIILLLSLGLVASCGTDNRYADTLASGDEQQTKQGSNTGKIVGGVAAGAVVAACIVVNIKKRCIPFAKKLARKGTKIEAQKTTDAVPQKEVDELLTKLREAEIRKTEKQKSKQQQLYGDNSDATTKSASDTATKSASDTATESAVEADKPKTIRAEIENAQSFTKEEDARKFDMFLERSKSLADHDKIEKLMKGGSRIGSEKAEKHLFEAQEKALKQLLDEGKLTPEDIKKIRESAGLN